jgi:hypothetical protein
VAEATRTDLIAVRSIRAILGATLVLYRDYPWLFALLALAVIAPYELAILAITGYGPLRHAHESFGVSQLLTLVRASLITPLISALHIHAVVMIGDGQRPRLRLVAVRGLAVLPVVAAAEVMANIGILLGLIVFIIPGVLLSLRWAVVAQAAALENEGWLEALRSSQDLTASHYWYVLRLLFVTGVFVLGLTIGAEALRLGSTSGVASVVVGIAVDTVGASLAALTLALLYFSLRAMSGEPFEGDSVRA